MIQEVELQRVQLKKVERYLHISREVIEIDRRLGIKSVLTRLTEGCAKSRHLGLFDVVKTGPEEQFFMFVSSYQDEEQRRQLMEKFVADPRIHELYQEIQEVLDVEAIIRWRVKQVI